MNHKRGISYSQLPAVMLPLLENAVIKAMSGTCRLSAKPKKPYSIGVDTGSHGFEIAVSFDVVAQDFAINLCLGFDSVVFFRVVSKIASRDITSMSRDVEAPLTLVVDAILAQLEDSLSGGEKVLRTAVKLWHAAHPEGLVLRHLAQVPTVILPFDSQSGEFSLAVAISGLKSS